ncbi:MAG: MBL fold metallo-hydrolase [Parasporobacterium sp.]|nr:MBL fold metallo-hydrolase [Parasporobacterium sp.]
MDQKQLEMIFGKYFAWMAKPGTWVISFMEGTQNLFLLEGAEKALLIDTGYAIGNLRAFVEKLTQKPILVVNTHFHPDHSGGNGEWEEVMVSEDYAYDAPSVLTTMGDLNALPYPDYRKILLKDGDEIDLGERIIKVYKARNAHCRSHLYFLDTRERIFFMGDEMDSWQVLLYENSKDPELEKIEDLDQILRNYRSNLELAKSLNPEYDWLVGNHNGFLFDKSYIDDFLGMIDGVYSGETTICERLDHPYIDHDPRASELCRIRYRKASAFVRKHLLEKIYGKGTGRN